MQFCLALEYLTVTHLAHLIIFLLRRILIACVGQPIISVEREVYSKKGGRSYLGFLTSAVLRWVIFIRNSDLLTPLTTISSPY